MTSQDNLRGRIAGVIYRIGNGELALNTFPGERATLAQAIIDEFGLRWEHQPVIGGTRKRIIGDWKGEKGEAEK